MKVFVSLIASAVVLLVLILSCAKDQTPVATVAPADCPDTISFSQQILPMFQANCTSCHSPQGGTTPLLTNYSEISAQAAKSLPSIRWDNGALKMPDGSPQLADSLIQQFSCWITQGKLNN